MERSNTPTSNTSRTVNFRFIIVSGISFFLGLQFSHLKELFQTDFNDGVLIDHDATEYMTWAPDEVEQVERESNPDNHSKKLSTTSSCTFCKTLNEPELLVAGTGGNTCGSIQLLAANEVNGSDACAIMQKEERVCCPGSEASHQDEVAYHSEYYRSSAT